MAPGLQARVLVLPRGLPAQETPQPANAWGHGRAAVFSGLRLSSSGLPQIPLAGLRQGSVAIMGRLSCAVLYPGECSFPGVEAALGWQSFCFVLPAVAPLESLWMTLIVSASLDFCQQAKTPQQIQLSPKWCRVLIILFTDSISIQSHTERS